MAAKKNVVETIKKTVNKYDDGTVITEGKKIVGEEVQVLPKVVLQDKLTRKKQNERALVSQEKTTEYIYEDGEKLSQVKIYEVKKGEKALVKDLVIVEK